MTSQAHYFVVVVVVFKAKPGINVTGGANKMVQWVALGTQV